MVHCARGTDLGGDPPDQRCQLVEPQHLYHRQRVRHHGAAHDDTAKGPPAVTTGDKFVPHLARDDAVRATLPWS
jgi:hypothetical protein